MNARYKRGLKELARTAIHTIVFLAVALVFVQAAGEVFYFGFDKGATLQNQADREACQAIIDKLQKPMI